MPRICAACGRPPREGEEMRAIRLFTEDLKELPASKPGLYSSCSDCVDAHRARVAERLGKESSQVTYGELV